jgi:hypothetical protein
MVIAVVPHLNDVKHIGVLNCMFSNFNIQTILNDLNLS